MFELLTNTSFGEIFNNPFWQSSFFGNSLLNYLDATVRLFVIIVLLIIVKQMLFRIGKLRHGKNKESQLKSLVSLVKVPFLIYLSLYFSIQSLSLPIEVKNASDQLLMIFSTWQIIILLEETIFFFTQKIFNADQKSDEPKMIGGMVKTIIKLALWTLGILFILSNLGINIITLIAGLGVGGAAIAIGMQNILQDLFSSFAIFMDKPFSVGDFIVVGENMGTVQKIGIKTTRIKSLQGEEIIITNKELTSARIQNFRSMRERRVVFNFGVTYQTDQKILESIPGLVRDLIENTELARFDRAHLNAFDASALNYEVVYYVESGDYQKYMDTNQKIHLGIIDLFNKKGINMAYPTQTIHLAK